MESDPAGENLLLSMLVIGDILWSVCSFDLSKQKPNSCYGSCPVNCRRPFNFLASFCLVLTNKSFFFGQRYGVWADWGNPYLTLSPEYEAAQVPAFTKYINNKYAILCM